MSGSLEEVRAHKQFGGFTRYFTHLLGGVPEQR